MNAGRHFSNREIIGQPKPQVPPSTIQMEQPQKPSIEKHDPNQEGRKGQRAAAKMKAIEAAMESTTTLSGLTEKECRREKEWLKQEGPRLRAKNTDLTQNDEP